MYKIMVHPNELPVLNKEIVRKRCHNAVGPAVLVPRDVGGWSAMVLYCEGGDHEQKSGITFRRSMN
jgi:hypothetical protein